MEWEEIKNRMEKLAKHNEEELKNILKDLLEYEQNLKEK